MGKGARIKAKKAEKAATFAGPQNIELCNPVSQHFPAFILGNAAAWEQLAMRDLIQKAPEAYDALMAAAPTLDTIGFNARFRGLVVEHGVDHMVHQDSAKGQHVVICGAGPSLAENAAEWIPQADQVWGCNSAVTWLLNNGYRCTHALTVDQTAHMVEEWVTAPDVEYLLASTVHPHLVEYLLQRDRRVTFFHNFVGIQRPPVEWEDEDGGKASMSYEDWMYCTLFPTSVRVGSGLNTATRAIDVALFMGFDQITLLGADCALRITAPPPGTGPGTPEHERWLRECTIMHADGGNALASGATGLTLNATIDDETEDDTIRPGHGRYWETKIDLIISAIFLRDMERGLEGRLRIVGDTLVHALRNKSEAYVNRLPNLVDKHGNRLIFMKGVANAAL